MRCSHRQRASTRTHIALLAFQLPLLQLLLVQSHRAAAALHDSFYPSFFQVFDADNNTLLNNTELRHGLLTPELHMQNWGGLFTPVWAQNAINSTDLHDQK